MFRFALSIFLSAFLLFQVQPLICKAILPWFGGSSSVWATCVAFFQTVLFGGYLYAHLLVTHCSRRTQGWVHCGLLAAGIVFLPILPAEYWKPESGDAPFQNILLLLAATVGLPFFVLSANGPLVQAWFAYERPEKSPYRLYALSNVGSLLALVTYPFVIEPLLSVRMQAWVWSGLFVAFAGVCAASALKHPAAQPNAAPAGSEPEEIPAPSLNARVAWVLLPACASLLLVASTNVLSQDIAVVPFLWVLPLSVYLISFIFTFESERWYHRIAFAVALVAAINGVYFAFDYGVDMPLLAQLAIHSGVLFTCCMICHGELVRLKPHPRHLTSFYFLLSAGGALGGIAATFGAPLLFTDLWEYPLGVLFCGVLLLWMLSSGRNAPLRGVVAKVVLPLGVLALAVYGTFFRMNFKANNADAIAKRRSFYGILKVNEHLHEEPPFRTLMHGRINHGTQYLDPAVSATPVSYYGEDSGVGVAVRVLRKVHPETPLHIGVVGLGTGTMAAWGERGDSVRFYDINPQVIEIARKYFTYMSDSKATVTIVNGDARLSIEREARAPEATREPPLDLLALDAFSGDAIPLHLLTREAFVSYWQRLRRDGILAVHISNRFINLEPLVTGLSKDAGYETAYIDAYAHEFDESSTWILVTSNPLYLNDRLMKFHASLPAVSREPVVFTDDFSNLFRILKR
jgi:spermidine synthase